MINNLKVWYFSGTGQCKNLSEHIAMNLESQGNQVEITDITPLETRNCMKKNIDFGQIILVFPIYGSDLPVPFKEFISELRTQAACVLLIALWGNSHKGKALHNASKILSAQGFIVNGATEIVAEHSYLGKTFPIISKRPTEDEKHQLMLYINKHLLKNKQVSISKHTDNIFVKILCALPQGFASKLISKISLQQDKCNQCGICIKKCPTGAINKDFTVEYKKCIMCLSCVRCCKSLARKFIINGLGIRALGSHVKIQHENIFYD